jgi:hypothetical protein
MAFSKKPKRVASNKADINVAVGGSWYILFAVSFSHILCDVLVFLDYLFATITG